MAGGKQRVAIVTGASRGIGAAIAQRLAADGFAVVVNYSGNVRDADVLVDAIASKGGGFPGLSARKSRTDNTL